jgi:hypothetical protein
MGALNQSAFFIALLISAGEIARFSGSERFNPMAIDEQRSSRDGASWHLAA